jgi:hypothetical protein
MPSIIPGYVYTLFASIIIGTLIISMCGLTLANVKREAEEQQLSSIVGYVAVKSMTLVAYAPADNLTSTVRLDLPSIVGNQQYWIQILNDSSKTWVEAGFGTTIISSNQRAYIPSELSASGAYTSGSSAAFLECYSDSAGVHLTLYGGS